MNAMLNRPLFLMLTITVIISAFLCGVAAAPMIVGVKAADGAPKHAARISWAETTPVYSDVLVGCKNNDMMWQPAALDVRQVRNTYFKVRF